MEKFLVFLFNLEVKTPLKIANELENEGVNILGTTTEAIDLAEDRDRFSETFIKFKYSTTKKWFCKKFK